MSNTKKVQGSASEALGTRLHHARSVTAALQARAWGKGLKAQGYHTIALGLRLEVGGGKLKDKD